MAVGLYRAGFLSLAIYNQHRSTSPTTSNNSTISNNTIFVTMNNTATIVTVTPPSSSSPPTTVQSLTMQYHYQYQYQFSTLDKTLINAPMSSTYSPVSSTVPDLVADTSIDDELNDLFDFESYEPDAHSPKTISPNHTPSPPPTPTSHSLFARSTSPMKSFFHTGGEASGSGSSALDFSFGYQPDADPVKVKDEPIDWAGYRFGFGTNELGAPPLDIDTTSTKSSRSIFSTDVSTVPPPPLPASTSGGLPKDQQEALQQLMVDFLQYQNKFGVDAAPTPAPTTIEPSLLLSTSPTNTFNFGSAYTSTNATASGSGSNTGSYTTPAPLPPISEHDSDHDEPLRSVHDRAGSASAGPSRLRQSSVLSTTSDIGSRLNRLEPREAIFSAGKGKGGKKGGGLSSVVRGDDEDLDDDDSWRPSPEEYKKLSSKEKRQLRNKLSARAFRTRRKDYIGTLEGHIKDRDDVIDEMKTQLITHRIENEDLRKELETLKASTMKILHPETAFALSEPAPLISAFTLSPALSAVPASAPTPSKKRMLSPAPTPKFNPRKDLPSSSTEASRGFWGNDNMFGGGSTICHHTFMPPPVFKQSQANMNPLIDSETVKVAPSESKDLSMPFAEWSENNNFNLRSMDSYRMQMWSRLTREAQAEKDHIPTDLRPKFYESPSPSSAEASLAAHLASATATHITSKLASSFWSAFSGPSSLDTDKLSAVVTGTARLAVVPTTTMAHTYTPTPEVSEKHTSPAGPEEDALTALMGGLKLQTGGLHCRAGMNVRENPLGALGRIIKFCPTGA